MPSKHSHRWDWCKEVADKYIAEHPEEFEDSDDESDDQEDQSRNEEED